MSAISSLYISNIEKDMNADFIAFIFEKTQIAQVSRVAIEYNKKNKKYSAFVGIQYWNDTESAYNFITRLKNPHKEARMVYSDDQWWVVEINKFPHKLLSSNAKRQLTVYPTFDINIRLTNLLKTILFGEPIEPDFYPTFDEDLDQYQDEDQYQDQYQDQDADQDARDFEDYLRDIEIERQIWISEMNC
jgi:hypothetical protein